MEEGAYVFRINGGRPKLLFFAWCQIYPAFFSPIFVLLSEHGEGSKSSLYSNRTNFEHSFGLL